MPPQCTTFAAALFALPCSWAGAGLAANMAATADAISAPFIVFPFNIDPPLNVACCPRPGPGWSQHVAKAALGAPLLRLAESFGYRFVYSVTFACCGGFMNTLLGN